MSHIHEKIDFVVSALIVHSGRVLFVHHKGANRWFAPGGHVELDEDTDQALFREIEEETGLTSDDVEILEEKLDIPHSETGGQLYRPRFMNFHRIENTAHHHIGLYYVFRSTTDAVRLQPDESYAIRWFRPEELHDPALNVPKGLIRYAEEAVRIAA